MNQKLFKKMMSLPSLLELTEVMVAQIGQCQENEDGDTIRRVDLTVDQWTTVLTAVTALTFSQHGAAAAGQQVNKARLQ